MIAERYELRADHTDWLDVRDPQGYRNTINQPGAVALIRQQARDIAELRADLAAAVAEKNSAVARLEGFPNLDAMRECMIASADENADLRRELAAAVAERDSFRSECDLLTHKVICCGVAAWHSDPLLTTTGAYAGKWNSPQADCVRKLRAERDQLRADLAAAVAERDTLRDSDVFSRKELVRGNEIIDDLRIERDTLRARLAAIDGAPGVAWLCTADDGLSDATVSKYVRNIYAKSGRAIAELIARPAED